LYKIYQAAAAAVSSPPFHSIRSYFGAGQRVLNLDVGLHLANFQLHPAIFYLLPHAQGSKVIFMPIVGQRYMRVWVLEVPVDVDGHGNGNGNRIGIGLDWG